MSYTVKSILDMLESDEFKTLVESGAIKYLENDDTSIVLSYTSKHYHGTDEVVITNTIKRSY